MQATRRGVIGGLFASVSAAAVAGCVSTNPATGRSSFTGLYDVEDDKRLGAGEHPKRLQAFGGEYQDPRLQAYVADIGARVAQHSEFTEFQYRFFLLNSPVVNAFALPGGYCYISRGLLALASDEAEVAGVLAHEVGHVNARHTAERLTSGTLAQIGVAVLGIATGSSALANMGGYAATAYIQGFSREQELEADTLGIRYMSRAGYDPNAMVSFLETLRAHSMIEAEANGLPPGSVDEYNVMATHPRGAQRVQEAVQQVRAGGVTGGERARERYLAQIDGMLYGDDPKEGQVVGQMFQHRDLRLQFEAPEGFRLRNNPDRVVATRPGGAAMLFDMGRARSNDLIAYLDREWAEPGVLSNLQRLEINGLRAATGTVRMNTRGGQADIRPVVIEGDGDRVFRLLFLSPVDQTAGLNEPFRRATYSFRRLTEREAAAIQPQRLLIVAAGAGSDPAVLGRPLPYGNLNAKAWAVMNDLQPGQCPAQGQPIKVIGT